MLTEKVRCIETVNEMKSKIIGRLERRIGLLRAHRGEAIAASPNQYEQLNDALSRVIGVALEKELEDIRDFIQDL